MLNVEEQLDGLYRGVIMDHYRRPRNRGNLAGMGKVAEGKNPLCGDSVRFEMIVRDGTVEKIVFDGHGCAISISSASMLTELLQGKTVEEAKALIAQAADFLKGERDGVDEEELGDVAALEGVAKFPVRIKCALLPFVAVRGALEEK
jgi:nitrogen fixation NifU-like protein